LIIKPVAWSLYRFRYTGSHKHTVLIYFKALIARLLLVDPYKHVINQVDIFRLIALCIIVWICHGSKIVVLCVLLCPFTRICYILYAVYNLFQSKQPPYIQFKSFKFIFSQNLAFSATLLM
jgi:hypothetical protein